MVVSLTMLVLVVSVCFCTSKVMLPIWYSLPFLFRLPLIRRMMASMRSNISSIENGVVM